MNSWHDKIFIADPRITIDHIYTIGLRCLGNFSTTYGPIFNFPVYATELKLDFEVEGYKFRGILDRVDRIDDNQIMVVDYKTSKRYGPYLPDDYYVQLIIYAFLYTLEMGDMPNFVGVSYLRFDDTFYVKVNQNKMKN